VLVTVSVSSWSNMMAAVTKGDNVANCRGADAGLADGGGRTPLHWAAHNDDDGVLRVLLGAPNVDQGAVDGGGLTALDLAMQNEGAAALRVLQSMETS